MLSAKQNALILAMLTAPSVEVACKTAGTTKRSYSRWLQDDEFKAALQKARQTALADAIGLLQGLMRPAARTLRKCLVSKRDSDRIKAALGILDRAIRGTELTDLLDRVAALEKSVTLKNRVADLERVTTPPADPPVLDNLTDERRAELIVGIGVRFFGLLDVGDDQAMLRLKLALIDGAIRAGRTFDADDFERDLPRYLHALRMKRQEGQLPPAWAPTRPIAAGDSPAVGPMLDVADCEPLTL